MGSNGRLCSGRGAPVNAAGMCVCHVGYQGEACDQCSLGFTLAAGLCQRSYDSLAVRGASGTNGTASSSADAARQVR